jgi:hypothetical protein
MPTGILPKIVPGVSRFGMLVAAEDLGTDDHGNRWWNCRCDCGKAKKVSQPSLRAGGTNSCGCMKGEWIARARYKHGGTPRGGRMSEYRIWGTMLDRCHNPKAQRYPEYGGRGIAVCDQWRGEGGFANFLADMGRKPTPKHEIDRTDNDGPYSPENCRWATRKEQMNNTRKTRRLTFRGRTQTVSQWCEELGVSKATVFRRLADGWTTERAMTEPPDTRKGRRRQ